MLKEKLLEKYNEYKKELDNLTKAISEIELGVVLADDIPVLQRLNQRRAIAEEVTRVLGKLIQE